MHEFHYKGFLLD